MKACVIITANNPEVYKTVADQKRCGPVDVVVNQANDPLDKFLVKIFSVCPQKLDESDVIILLHNQDRLAAPNVIEKILKTFHNNQYVAALYSDYKDMVDGFLINRYNPAYYRGVTNALSINSPIAFKAGFVNNLPRKFTNIYHEFFVAATQQNMGHHIAEPLFICQL